MDIKFFSSRIDCITNYQSSFIMGDKERRIYLDYVNKLKSEILDRSSYSKMNFSSAKAIIENFKSKENRIFGYFQSRSRKLFNKSCEDVFDVVKSMQRYEGFGGCK